MASNLLLPPDFLAISFLTPCYTSSLPPLLSCNISFFCFLPPHLPQHSFLSLSFLFFPLFLSLPPAFSPWAKHTNKVSFLSSQRFCEVWCNFPLGVSFSLCSQLKSLKPIAESLCSPCRSLAACPVWLLPPQTAILSLVLFPAFV